MPLNNLAAVTAGGAVAIEVAEAAFAGVALSNPVGIGLAVVGVGLLALTYPPIREQVVAQLPDFLKTQPPVMPLNTKEAHQTTIGISIGAQSTVTSAIPASDVFPTTMNKSQRNWRARARGDANGTPTDKRLFGKRNAVPPMRDSRPGRNHSHK